MDQIAKRPRRIFTLTSDKEYRASSASVFGRHRGEAALHDADIGMLASA